jgi:glycosyltransferase involved in cell wall biosynthesis
MAPPVTLAIPVYNGERFLDQAIASLRAQTFGAFELLIVDNASTDSTLDIAQRAARDDARIRLVRNATNLGAGGNFNRCVDLARGALFKWCAHDDLIDPTYLARCVAALAAHPEAATAYGRLVGIDAEGQPTGYIEPPLDLPEDAPAARRFRALIYRQGLDAAIFGLHRRSALQASSLHLPYYGSDCALLAELGLIGRFVHMPDAVLFSRDHPGRSVNMASTERLAWQAPVTRQANPHEFSSRVGHLLGIARRHRARAPLAVTGPAVLVWAAHPVRLGRMGLELVGAFSPGLRARLRVLGLRALRPFGGSTGKRGRQDA